jgi:serine protease Do
MAYGPHNGISRSLISFFVILFVLGLGIGIGTLISHQVAATGPGDSQIRIQGNATQTGVNPSVLALSQAFEEVATRIAPAVVNINTEEVVRVPRSGSGRQQMPDLLRQFMPDQPQAYTQSSLGSGVIVDPKGYIITNNHVVEGATKIMVSVKDGKEYKAKVIAGDDLSDIAVIKIDGDKDFPTARIGDAKAMKVGDWVIAIGSPFGLEQTVTAGIISASGRIFSDASQGSSNMLFNDYLQTDAAINPGNSGGPLVNMNGEVVGINSFISTSSRSSAGVGFAVPSHIFVQVYNQILEKGKVARGFLGILMNAQFPFTEAMANYFGVKQGSGVLVTGFSTDSPSPAQKAGMAAEDVIVEFDGKKITDVQTLRMAAANAAPGRTVGVKIVRHGQIKDLSITLVERPPDRPSQTGSGFNLDNKEETKPEIGMSIDNVPPRYARDLDITGGALITQVSPGSLAEEAGIIGQASQEGAFDIVLAVNGKTIEVYQDLVTVLKDLKPGQAAVLKIMRVGQDAAGKLAGTLGYTSLIKP